MKQRAMAIAIAVTMTTTAVLSAVPAAAVSADCTSDYTIQDTEPSTPRVLLGLTSETGVEDVTAAGGTENVTIRLDSNNDKLEFGVFVLDANQDCVAATDEGISDCSSAETLDTTGTAATDKITCRLDPPSSGTRDYFFHVENSQADSLDYTPWMSD